MELEMDRLISDTDATVGFLRVDDKGECFTLEDENRAIKVMGETRIPAGRYEIKLRDAGGVNARYHLKFPDIHKGMLWLQDVPNFTWIYIHVGNIDDHTDGCILTGDSANIKLDKKSIGHSRDAYERLYVKVAKVLLSGEKVFITINDKDI